METGEVARVGDPAMLHNEVISQLLEAMAGTDSVQQTQSGSSVASAHEPKWRKDLEGLVDPEEIEMLQQFEQVLAEEPRSTSTTSELRLN